MAGTVVSVAIQLLTFIVSDSILIQVIARERNLNWESQNDVRGKPIAKLDNIPPCVYSSNAFGKENGKAYSKPPEWFGDESKVKYWDLVGISRLKSFGDSKSPKFLF